MALNDVEHAELVRLLEESLAEAKAATQRLEEALNNSSMMRSAAVSAAQTAQLAIERLQKQQPLINTALDWVDGEASLEQLSLAVKNYRKKSTEQLS